MEEPGNVKDLIQDVKNLSGLMLNLAYSSVFFESKEIAKEVIILYNDIESLEENLYLHLFAASRGGHQAKRLIGVIDVAESSKFVANAARNMAEMVLEGRELHPVIKDALRESDESIARETVLKKSILVGKTLGDMKLRTETGANVIGIKRAGKWIFNPEETAPIRDEDVLIFVGSKESCKRLHKLARGELKKL
ncbi:MAG: potassium channel protein [Candidatus Aenigmarchaeota archaeon]|nr:potassium channel protein [Candidatus Aenigmarchaeota archaeon]